MRSNPHPRVLRAQGTRPGTRTVGCVVFAPDPRRADWIGAELEHEPLVIQIGRGIADVIAALVDDPPPRPQILIVDIDPLTAAEIVELHTIRERGWTGTIVALGRLSPAFRRSLRVGHVIELLVTDALRRAVRDPGFDAKTRKLPALRP